MILYIAEYHNESYTGSQFELELLNKTDISLFDLNVIFKDFQQTPTSNDLLQLKSSGRCLIKADNSDKKLIFLVDPIHSQSKQIIRQILLNKIT